MSTAPGSPAAQSPDGPASVPALHHWVGGGDHEGSAERFSDVTDPATGRGHEGIVAHAARIGEEVLGPGLRELPQRHSSIGEGRGLGVIWALDLVTARTTREPLAPYGGTSPAVPQLVAAWKAEGVLPFVDFHRRARRSTVHGLAEEVKEALAAPRQGLRRGRHALHERPMLRDMTRTPVSRLLGDLR